MSLFAKVICGMGILLFTAFNTPVSQAQNMRNNVYSQELISDGDWEADVINAALIVIAAPMQKSKAAPQTTPNDEKPQSDLLDIVKRENIRAREDKAVTLENFTMLNMMTLDVKNVIKGPEVKAVTLSLAKDKTLDPQGLYLVILRAGKSSLYQEINAADDPLVLKVKAML